MIGVISLLDSGKAFLEAYALVPCNAQAAALGRAWRTVLYPGISLDRARQGYARIQNRCKGQSGRQTCMTHMVQV